MVSKGRSGYLVSLLAIILCFAFFRVNAGSMVKGQLISIEMEPLLAGEITAYRGSEGLYLLGKEHQTPVAAGPRSEGSQSIVMSARLNLSDQRLTAAWIEKLPEGYRLLSAVFSSPNLHRESFRVIAEKTNSTILDLQPVKDSLYCIDAAFGKNPSVFLTRLAGSEISREAIAISGFEDVRNLSTLSSGQFLYIFLNGLFQGRSIIGMLRYDTEAKRADTVEVVAETPVTPLMETVALSGKPAIIFKVYKEGQFSLQLAVKKTAGWSVSPVTAAGGLDVARLDSHVWPDDRLLLVFSGEQRGQTKQRVYAAFTNELGVHWRMQQLDSAEFNNTRAWLPRMAVSGERVAVVWEDARDIRSRIRLQLSRDRGENWLKKDIALSEERFYSMRPRISNVDDQLYIVWQQYRTDARREADLLMRGLPWDEAWSMVKETDKDLSLQEKQGQLTMSINAFWKAIQEDRREAGYQAYDPFYRAKVDFSQYLIHFKPVAFTNHEVKNISVQGNEGTAMVLLQRSLSDLPITVRDTWLYIDGRWYRKFTDDLSGASAIIY